MMVYFSFGERSGLRDFPVPVTGYGRSMKEQVSYLPDPEDLGDQFEKIRPELRAYVTSILGNSNGVEDVLQESAIVVLDKREEVVGLRDFKSWCLRIAYFKALAYRRDQSRRGELNLRSEILD